MGAGRSGSPPPLRSSRVRMRQPADGCVALQCRTLPVPHSACQLWWSRQLVQLPAQLDLYCSFRGHLLQAWKYKWVERWSEEHQRPYFYNQASCCGVGRGWAGLGRGGQGEGSATDSSCPTSAASPSPCPSLPRLPARLHPPSPCTCPLAPCPPPQHTKASIWNRPADLAWVRVRVTEANRGSLPPRPWSPGQPTTTGAGGGASAAAGVQQQMQAQAQAQAQPGQQQPGAEAAAAALNGGGATAAAAAA